MPILLDSNALYWWMVEPTRLSRDAVAAIAADAVVLTSAASVWELEIKRASGKLLLDDMAWNDLEAERIDVLPITRSDVVAAARLPFLHKDPFDRVIVAQARARSLTVVTSDVIFRDYGVTVLRA